MYIIAIGWLYVTLLMALTETSFAAGAATFLLYGLFPLSILLYLLGTPQRRRNRRAREAVSQGSAESATESAAGAGDAALETAQGSSQISEANRPVTRSRR